MLFKLYFHCFSVKWLIFCDRNNNLKCIYLLQMDVFGQVLHFTPLFTSRRNPSKYAIQLKHNSIKHIVNKFYLGFSRSYLFNHRQGKTSTLSKFGAILSSRSVVQNSASFFFHPSYLTSDNDKFNPLLRVLK